MYPDESNWCPPIMLAMQKDFATQKDFKNIFEEKLLMINLLIKNSQVFSPLRLSIFQRIKIHQDLRGLGRIQRIKHSFS